MSLRCLPPVLAGLALLGGCATANPTATPAGTASASPSASSVASAAATEPLGIPLPSQTATASSTGASTPQSVTGQAVTGQPVDAQAAGQLMPGFTAYYAAADQVLQAGGLGAPTQAMRNTMAGAVLDSWTKQAAAYAAKGYRQSGTTRVESFSPGGVDNAAGTAQADFCANASGVTVTDGSGRTILPADPTKRAVGATASLVYSGGHWRVVSLSGVTPLAGCP